MTNKFYQKIVSTFHTWERQDFDAICNMIDKRTGKGSVAVISNYPYLLFLIFTALIRYYGIRIHLINPAEGEREVERLISSIDPDYVIVTDEGLKKYLNSRTGYRTILVNGDTVSNEQDEFDYNSSIIPEEIDFNIVSYTPFPTKVHTVSAEMFRTMVDAMINDLYSFGLVSPNDHGMIPFISNNPDYLLYYLAVKLATFEQSASMLHKILPGKDEITFPVKNKKEYLEHNNSRTLFIPKKEFVELWEENVSSLFEYKWVFSSYLKRKWLVNILIKRRLKKLFVGFKNILIIGMLDNAYMVDVLKNLSFTKFYTILPMPQAFMYGPISSSLENLTLASNEYRQDIPKESINGVFKGNPICSIAHRLYHPDNDTQYTILNAYDRFVNGRGTVVDGELRRHYYYLGSIENSIYRDKDLIFPETLERVINSYPFIRSSVLLAFEKRMVLVLHPNEGVLDANRINRGMFRSIIKQQIKSLNEELPESYKIQGFVVSTSIIEHNRVGEIVRWPFNACNKLSG